MTRDILSHEGPIPHDVMHMKAISAFWYGCTFSCLNPSEGYMHYMCYTLNSQTLQQLKGFKYYK